MKQISIFLLLFNIFISSTIYAGDTGKQINVMCRNNLKMLNQGTKELLSNEKIIMHPWTSYEDFIKKASLEKYIKETPKSPTIDCNYFLVNKGNNFQWCCSLHGVVDGNKTITFKYHEYELMAKTNSEFESIPEYSKHEKDILGWLDYSRSPKEMLIFNFNANPIVTTIFCIIVLFITLFLIKTIY